ncbi:polyphosphate polymerase domain-containing protein [Enterococcus sp.]|uniref:polyphosphate polymerase domain-containing protein n=1 Tax=Enterococcus sp. TaxID=35783 RepID=UPI0025BA5DEE|nr:polyphosphate polymerase domain-containing protein [Enterococcus sp.]
MKLKKVFQRKETKYLLAPEQFQQFMYELQQVMKVDEYGQHTILSLYYDTSDYRFIRHSMDKPKYKEKFRIRSYGVPTAESLVFLEIKKKVNGIVYKRRIPMAYSDYQTWLVSGEFPASIQPVQIASEINWLFKQNPDLKPRVMIAYDRISLFVENDSEFRVTFDQNIRYRNNNLDLDEGSYGQLVAPEVGVLMEVKAMGAYPLWFVELLNRYEVRKASFSKYAQTYQRHLFMKEDISYVV